MSIGFIVFIVNNINYATVAEQNKILRIIINMYILYRQIGDE